MISGRRELLRVSGDKTDWKSPVSALKSAGAVAAALLPEGKRMILTAESSGAGASELLTTSDAGKTWNPHPLEGVAQDAFDTLRDSCPMQVADGGTAGFWPRTDCFRLRTAAEAGPGADSVLEDGGLYVWG